MDLHAVPTHAGAPLRHDATSATPAALVAGQVAAADAPHPLSVFDMFRIGIGPSSSHTVGPMRAGLDFATELAALRRARPGAPEVEEIPEAPEAPGAPKVRRISVDLLGSLGATGRGHNTDRAVLLGLAGHDPATVPTGTVESILPEVAATGELTLADGTHVPFRIDEDIRFRALTRLPYHVNALVISAWTGTDPGTNTDTDTDTDQTPTPAQHPGAGPTPHLLLRRTYYSVGGGFVMVQTNDDPDHPLVESLATPDATATLGMAAPHPFADAEELLEHCDAHGLTIAEVVRENEESMRTRDDLDAHLDLIAAEMFACVEAGTSASGLLPGGLDVPRRARALAEQLRARSAPDRDGGGPVGTQWASTREDPMRAMDWVNLFALAVNEENAAGHRVVTAPTNGAAGVVPAVLGYLVVFCPEAGVLDPSGAPTPGQPLLPVLAPGGAPGSGGASTGVGRGTDEGGAPDTARRRSRSIRDFLLAATAIGALIKTNASIAGAEVGCQGEVGSASAMAAAGLAQALGGTPRQVENAAEIAMEHSLGLTCDPVGGLVQIPCIERNAIAAVKAINAARMALWGDGRHTVSLDAVIETMRQTGNDMLSKYKETSAGGLAVNVVEC